MIISRSPLRLSLGGGGTDLPSYYREHGGFLIAAAINKYVYITIHQRFVERCLLKYSRMEEVSEIADIQHPILREALLAFGGEHRNLEITSLADIPAGTGLGSSGSFTTALLTALHAYNKRVISPEMLAEQACHIEIDKLKEPIGKQDQYIAAFGGLRCFEFLPDDRVIVSPLSISEQTLFDLEDNLILFFTGFSRSASDILRTQHEKSAERDAAMLKNLHAVKEMGYLSKKLLESGHLREFAQLMHEHWEHKKKRVQNMSNTHIDDWYNLARQNGALGGKLIGAGGGGFLMFYTEDKSKLRHAMRSTGLREVRFKFDLAGSTLLAQ